MIKKILSASWSIWKGFSWFLLIFVGTPFYTFYFAFWNENAGFAALFGFLLGANLMIGFHELLDRKLKGRG